MPTASMKKLYNAYASIPMWRKWKSNRTGHGVLVLVDQVLGEVLHHQLVGLIGHPSVHKGREVQVRRAIEGELIVDDLVGGLGVGSLRRMSRLFAKHRRKQTLLGSLNLGTVVVP